jgi:hypothetical protein
MNPEPGRIFALLPYFDKTAWRHGRLAAILALRTAARGLIWPFFAGIWTHSSHRLPLNS